MLSSLRAVRSSFACWNVLADCYAYGQATLNQNGEGYPHYIHWAQRSEKIAQSLRCCNADIICLQEVDHYQDFYDPLLVGLGYDSIYLQRPSRQDGCLIAYKRDKIFVHKINEVQMDELADYMGSESSRANLKRSNVALIALMEYMDDERDERDPLGNNDRMFVTSTAHIYWNPERPEVKNLQTQYLVGRVEKFLTDCGLSRTTPTLITGDFNSIPYSEVYSTMTHGFQYLSNNKKIELPSSKGSLYGPGTKFLCDRNLSRLARWMRVLGIDAALIPEDKQVKTNKKAKQDFEDVFRRARQERRVLLTTSKSMRERASCPPSLFVSTKNLEAALIEICKEFGLTLNPDKFLTVCGKCSGEIEACSHTDPRVAGKNVPTDREIFICIDCQQPYWWNERENSSPARAMKMADQLYNAVTRGLGELALDDGGNAGASSGSASAATSAKTTVVTTTTTTTTTQTTSSSLTTTETVRTAADAAAASSETTTVTVSTTTTVTTTATAMAPATDSDEITDAIVSLPENSKLSALFALREKTVKAKVTVDIGDLTDEHDIYTTSKPDNLGDAPTAATAAAVNAVGGAAAETNGKEASERERESEREGRMQYSRKYRSAYAEVHASEPDATNWSHDFRNTLDYIFVGGNCEVRSADVFPATRSILLSRAAASAKRSLTAGGVGDVVEEGNQQREGAKVLEALEVESAQPSDSWPSDHFMLLTELTFPTNTVVDAEDATEKA